MFLDPSHRFRLLLDLGRHVIFLIDGTISRIAAPGSWWAPHRSSLPTPIRGAAITVPCDGRKLEGWFMTPDGGPAAAVLLLHGIGDRIVYWRAAQERMAKSGVCSLIFGYAGYGESEGKTSRENLEADAHAAYAWLRSRIPEPIPVYVLGFSLGTGLAAEIGPALMPPPAGIIMAEAFTTLRLAAKRVVLGLPLVANLLPDVWRTRENVTRLRVPLLIIHSNGDALFPRSMADEIYAAARAGGAPAELAVFESYRHNAPYLSVPEDYWAAILDFLHRHAPVTAARAD